MRGFACLIVGSLLVSVAPLAQAAPAKTRRVNETSAGQPADSWSYGSEISPNGRWVVFTSESTNLPGATGTHALVYVHDRETKKTRLVSKNSAGEPANEWSFDGSISDDGRFVAFTSGATNLPGGTGTYELVYVHDRKTKKTRLVSKTSSGEPADSWSGESSVSSNGRYVAFDSEASNLPGGAAHTGNMVYVHDRKAKKTRLVSKTSAGAPADDDSDDGSISPDGRFVAFESDASNLP
ncbi:MAG TPA: hypothetical protein VF058_10280, partial [Actinomycetota bacterium]